MSRREQAMDPVLVGVGAGVVSSLLDGRFWTMSMVWEIVFWVAVLALFSALVSYLERRRKAKRL